MMTSPPSRGAWIEITCCAASQNCIYDFVDVYKNRSRPPRGGAWIEINMHVATVFPGSVAPLAGGRGLKLDGTALDNIAKGVAPLAGGVD